MSPATLISYFLISIDGPTYERHNSHYKYNLPVISHNKYTLYNFILNLGAYFLFIVRHFPKQNQAFDIRSSLCCRSKKKKWPVNACKTMIFCVVANFAVCLHSACTLIGQPKLCIPNTLKTDLIFWHPQ